MSTSMHIYTQEENLNNGEDDLYPQGGGPCPLPLPPPYIRLGGSGVQEQEHMRTSPPPSSNEYENCII